MSRFIVVTVFMAFMSSVYAASGQGVALDHTAQVEECKNLLRDELHIGMALASGKPAYVLKADAAGVRKELGEDRYTRVLTLIDQANIEYLQGKLSKWFNTYWTACLNPI
jgi:hypothetical protein